MSDLLQSLEAVECSDSFGAFVKQLRREIATAERDDGPHGSANIALHPFLEAMERWVTTPAARGAIEGNNPWQGAARLLAMGHYYD